MVPTRKVQIGTMRGNGDIVARKTKDESGQTIIKIYQREKKPVLVQAFFRLHDLCSKNHTNITMSLNQYGFKTGKEKSGYILDTLINIKNNNAKNNIADYFLTSNVKVYKSDFYDFLIEKNFPLPDSKERRLNANQNMKPEFFRSALDLLELEYGDEDSKETKKNLVECYKSEQKYFSFSEKSDFLEIYSTIKNSLDENDDDLLNTLDFLYNKIVCGPVEIPYSDIKVELERKLNIDACKSLYKEATEAEWKDENGGSIVDFILKNTITDSRSDKQSQFLTKFLKKLQDGSLLNSEEKLFPCMQERMQDYFNPLTDSTNYNPPPIWRSSALE